MRGDAYEEDLQDVDVGTFGDGASEDPGVPPEERPTRSLQSLLGKVLARAKPLDENDRLRAGTLDPDPEAGTVLVSLPTIGQAARSAEEKARAAARKRTGVTIGDVLSEWAKGGPLVHEPTGIAQLDDLTGGGPVYGSRWYLNGAPDAGKTALLVQLADAFSARGVTVGLLAIDEEAGDIVTRLAQRIGYARGVLEARGHGTLDAIHEAIGQRPLRFYDANWTIEAAAADLAAIAAERAKADPANHPHGPKALLCIDSVQTVRCDAEAAAERQMSTVDAVTARVQALRAVATRYRLIAIATSEMGRAAYAKADPSERTSTMAGAKWSGAVEYSARVLLGVRTVSGEKDLIELEVAKNKHGASGDLMYLRLDRRCQVLTETGYTAPPGTTGADRDAAKRGRVRGDALVVARVLGSKPGLGSRKLRAAVQAAGGFGAERTDAAVEFLGDAVVVRTGPGNARPMSLERSALPPDILEALDAPEP